MAEAKRHCHHNDLKNLCAPGISDTKNCTLYIDPQFASPALLAFLNNYVRSHRHPQPQFLGSDTLIFENSIYFHFFQGEFMMAFPHFKIVEIGQVIVRHEAPVPNAVHGELRVVDEYITLEHRIALRH
jgi:hypothetical protein